MEQITAQLQLEFFWRQNSTYTYLLNTHIRVSSPISIAAPPPPPKEKFGEKLK
jgi:hypothetical protein